jgi:hypothetical protein
MPTIWGTEMTFSEKVNDAFQQLLEKIPDGIASTSTAKYNDIKAIFSEELGIEEAEIYATGATSRVSNFDTRLAQGNQRNQKTSLGLAFLKQTLDGRGRDELIDGSRSSSISTCKKFVSGEERGTLYDDILVLLQIDNETKLFPLLLISNAGSVLRKKLIGLMPDLEIVEVAREGVVADAASNNLGTLASELPSYSSCLSEAFIDAATTSIQDSHLVFDKKTVLRVVASLLTKKLLILSGLSGSGKTKVAHCFAAWMADSVEQFKVVAVGADWTTNENLLGYQDALRPEIYRKPTNGALELMLRARDDSERPYFLILDEMNLSHVERYFADMLSAIESGESIALHSATEDLPGGNGDTLLVPARLELPRNLFIVGTVNVDETTYMFSPKVLDRANVIEFRATEDQIGTFLDNPQRIRMDALAGKGAGFGAAFVAAASGDAPLLADLPATIHDNGAQCAADLKARLVEAFKALAPIGAEFGFRTAFEISRFVAFHAVLTGPGWKFSDALDAQVYQKLMPKLHGSERRLGPVLKALEVFCMTHDCVASLEKIRRMQDRLKDGFTSYAEA